MTKMITLVKDGHEIVMPEDWPSRAKVEEEGYVLVEEKTEEQPEEKTSLQKGIENPIVKTPVDTTDPRTTLEKMTEKKPL